MKQILLSLIAFLLSSLIAVYAQTTVSGQVKDENGEGLIGVNIAIRGTVTGTVTDIDGNFSLKVNTPPPFVLVFTSVGYTNQELEITGAQSNISVVLEEQTLLGQEVVVSASRVEENIMQSPVSIEKMDIIAIQQAPSADFYDGITKLKGVSSQSGSLTFTSINTRGFATIANTRFVQLIDGMDNSAPTLNFPTGNLVGMSELDVESVELVPGAASALYGPNAFNGILFMNSKSPFEYQGLSVNAKVGITNSNEAGEGAQAHGTNPYTSFSVRYAKSFNDKFAFKVNFSYLDAEDWRANDYRSYRTTFSTLGNPNNPVFGDPDFDGLNSYGDETTVAFNGLPASSQQALVQGISTALAPVFGPQIGSDVIAQSLLSARLPSLFSDFRVNRTGFREENIVDNFDSRSIKADIAMHYRINDNLEAIYSYRFGSGASVYQGGERYALRDFNIQFHKLELRGKNFFARAYTSLTDDGDSYNLTALGTFANEILAPTSTVWLPNYLANYVGALLNPLAGGNPNILLGQNPTETQMATAHLLARQAADANRPAVGSNEYNQLMSQVRGDLFKRTPPGAGFVDNSRFYHAEFNYNLRDIIDFVDLQVGANYRLYDLFTDNTIFNEVGDGEGEFERVRINEYGVYTQASKSFLDDRLKLAASIRFDKNENFDGQITPRASIVYSFGKDAQHNLRSSFQTGFRNPDTQAQFIFFPSSSGTLLGSTRENAEPFGVHEGGAYSAASVANFQNSGNPADLQIVNLRYLQPEKLSVIEVGYKGLINNTFLLDANVYFNRYKDFISGQTVFSAQGGNNPNFVTSANPSGAFPQFTPFRPYVNSNNIIRSFGVGLGFTYRLPKDFVLSGNYSYADFSTDNESGDEFEVQFNTPNNKFNISIGNRKIAKNLGFDISYRWQENFIWQSAFAHGEIPSYGTLDAQVNYKIKSLKSVVKIGGTNLTGPDYITNFGGPIAGKMYFISITFDEFLR